MRIGDIYKRTSDMSHATPKIFIVTAFTKEYTTIKYEKDGKLRSGGVIPTRWLQQGEAYKKVGHLAIEKTIIQKLQAEGRKLDDR